MTVASPASLRLRKHEKGLTRMQRFLIVLLALSTVLLPAGMQAAPDAGSVASGTWGGEHITEDYWTEGQKSISRGL